ncbi:PilZ domain-containing protein [Evansella sp. AB-P1]|uniref:PilZ domain-containing protein n=1 Tax=Evansella sp. AB-P1 TaxID=3037653 RepID=UPI00241E4C3A|nr:PilZ domain-containing protein [Evansella sp. AB-P1]MDG5786737.1 PilZ domain-containing protein [Evansella sp. AB-P1]
MIFIIVTSQLLIIILFLLTLSLILFIRKKLKKLDQYKPTEVLSNNHSETKQVTNNKNKFLTVNVSEKCLVKFTEFENSKLTPLKDKIVEAKLEDISIGGARIVTNFSLPIHEPIYVQLHFSLKDKTFTLYAQIVRKIEKTKKDHYNYGLQFVKLSNSEEQQLFFTLNQLSAKKGNEYQGLQHDLEPRIN